MGTLAAYCQCSIGWVERNSGEMEKVWGDDVAPEAELWRYFSVNRFLETLTGRRLHFSAATQFNDPFEGAVEVVPSHEVGRPLGIAHQGLEDAFAALKRLTKISCWHIATSESDAMWRLYAARGRGVAVVSSLRRMQSSFLPFKLAPEYGVETLKFGSIRYVDLTTRRLNVNNLLRFYHNLCAVTVEVISRDVRDPGSLIPGLTSSSRLEILAGPTVLSAFGLCPSHAGAW